MRPNTNFELNVRDIEIIENALNHKLNRLSNSRITAVESTIIPEEKLDSVKEIDAEVREVRDLLGRLHHQKVWYRPKSETYVSG